MYRRLLTAVALFVFLAALAAASTIQRELSVEASTGPQGPNLATRLGVRVFPDGDSRPSLTTGATLSPYDGLERVDFWAKLPDGRDLSGNVRLILWPRAAEPQRLIDDFYCTGSFAWHLGAFSFRASADLSGDQRLGGFTSWSTIRAEASWREGVYSAKLSAPVFAASDTRLVWNGIVDVLAELLVYPRFVDALELDTVLLPTGERRSGIRAGGFAVELSRDRTLTLGCSARFADAQLTRRDAEITLDASSAHCTLDLQQAWQRGVQTWLTTVAGVVSASRSVIDEDGLALDLDVGGYARLLSGSDSDAENSAMGISIGAALDVDSKLSIEWILPFHGSVRYASQTLRNVRYIDDCWSVISLGWVTPETEDRPRCSVSSKAFLGRSADKGTWLPRIEWQRRYQWGTSPRKELAFSATVLADHTDEFRASFSIEGF